MYLQSILLEIGAEFSGLNSKKSVLFKYLQDKLIPGYVKNFEAKISQHFKSVLDQETW